jgi:hypothetical protein
VRWVALALLVAGVACGTGSTLPLAPGSNTGVERNGSISGTVVIYGTNTPLAGAGVKVAGAVAVTDSAGKFSVANIPSSGTAVLTASATGYVFRGIGYGLAVQRSGVTVDVIPDAPPFDLLFYRMFVRNAYEGTSLQATHRWTMAPSFYFKTLVETTGARVPDTTIARIADDFRKSVPELTGGKFGVAAVESGDDARPAADGWVNVTFYDQLGNAFGQSTVGGNSGTISIRFGMVSTPTTNPFNCSTPEVGVADHEITHTMGYYHTSNVYYDSFSGNGCPGDGRPDITKYHAAILYSRPNGNIDPDVDPDTIANTTSPANRQRLVISCVLGGRRDQ